MEVIVNKDNFEKEVINSEIDVIVDFWATWCGPCKMIAPELEKLAKENEGKIKVCKCNVDDEPILAQQHGIEFIPTLILYKGGKIIKTISGFFTKEEILEKLYN